MSHNKTQSNISKPSVISKERRNTLANLGILQEQKPSEKEQMKGKFARFRTLKGMDANKEKKEVAEPGKPKIRRGSLVQEKKLTPEQY